MKTLGSLGRIIFALPFIAIGVLHFKNAGKIASEFLEGWPINEAIVYISGLALIVAGVSIIIKFRAKIACLLLALYLLVVIAAIHLPGIWGPGELMLSPLLKDIALLGACLTYANILSK